MRSKATINNKPATIKNNVMPTAQSNKITGEATNKKIKASSKGNPLITKY